MNADTVESKPQIRSSSRSENGLSAVSELDGKNIYGVVVGFIPHDEP